MAKQALKTYKFQGKGVTALLGDESDTVTGAQLLPLVHITLPTQQPRRYFDPDALQNLVASIRTHGILTPLLVRPIGNDTYELIAGERRFRAAQELGLVEVPVLVRDLSDTEASEVALLENLQREDLNPVEETEGILELLERKLNQSRAEVITLLNRVAHPKRASVQNVLHSPEWKTVEAVFASVGRFTPNSFRASRLPLLKLPAEILTALRQGKIEYTKGLAIARLKDQQEREKLLEEAIAHQLPLTQIKKRIREQQPKQEMEEPSLIKQRWLKINRMLNRAELWKKLGTQREFEHLVSALENLLLHVEG